MCIVCIRLSCHDFGAYLQRNFDFGAYLQRIFSMGPSWIAEPTAMGFSIPAAFAKSSVTGTPSMTASSFLRSQRPRNGDQNLEEFLTIVGATPFRL